MAELYGTPHVDAQFDPQELIRGFRQGMLFRQQNELLTRRIDAAHVEILGEIGLEAIGGRDMYRADTSHVNPGRYGRYFGMVAERTKIQKDSATLEDRLTSAVVRAAVTVDSLQSGSGIIKRMRFYAPPGSGNSFYEAKAAEDTVSGTIKSISLKENRLRLTPQRFGKTVMSGDEYWISVVDSGGCANVSIAERAATVRDVRGPTFMDRMASMFPG